MTSNAADLNRKYFTVAELIARERTATESYPWAKPDRRPRALMPATELLRREGVRIDGIAEQPTEQVHVSKLLRRESDEPAPVKAPVKRQPDEPRRGTRAAAIGSAAALCGLTIAGLIALKPATPPDGANTASGEHGGSGATPSQGDVSSTTTVLKRASSNEDAAKKRSTPASDPAGGASTTPGAGSSTPADSAPPADSGPTQTSTPPPDSTTTPPPAEEPDEKPTQKPKPSPSDDDDGGIGGDGGLLDPILDPVNDLLDPLSGSVSGTLDGLTP